VCEVTVEGFGEWVVMGLGRGHWESGVVRKRELMKGLEEQWPMKE
jgi:hypothetical protein